MRYSFSLIITNLSGYGKCYITVMNCTPSTPTTQILQNRSISPAPSDLDLFVSGMRLVSQRLAPLHPADAPLTVRSRSRPPRRAPEAFGAVPNIRRGRARVNYWNGSVITYIDVGLIGDFFKKNKFSPNPLIGRFGKDRVPAKQSLLRWPCPQPSDHAIPCLWQNLESKV